jgi:parvulin-like peptidyl-prolyl isomerase
MSKENSNTSRKRRGGDGHTPQAVLTAALVASLAMLGFILLQSEGRSSTKALPPLPPEIEARRTPETAAGSGAGPAVTAQQPTVSAPAPRVDADLATDEQAAPATAAAQPAQAQGGPANQAQVATAPAAPAGQAPTAAAGQQTPIAETAAELPVVAPAGAMQGSGAPQAGTAAATASSGEDHLAEIQRYMERAAPPPAATGSLPIATPPPIAVPHQLARTTPSPTPFQSVLRRVHNIPTKLIQTPLPYVSNATPESGLSPAADPNLASDAGTAPRWNDPHNPLIQGLVTGDVPAPTVESGLPQVPAPTTARPSATPRRTPRRTPTPTAKPSPTTALPVQQSLTQTPEEVPAPTALAATPQIVAQAAATAVPTEAPSTPALQPTPAENTSASPSPTPTPAWTPAPTPRLFTKEIHTTGEFTVRKGRAVVTFSNVPVATVEGGASGTTASAEQAPSHDEPPVDPEKTTALPTGAGEAAQAATASPPADLPHFQPENDTEGGSRLERGLEELAKTGGESKLAQRLASKAIAASVGDKVLTREDLDRQVHAMEIVRGIKLDEDRRVNAEGLMAQDWAERTAVAAIARERGLTVSDDEVTAEIERRKARFGQNLPAALRSAGFTEEEVREEIRNTLLVEKYVEKTMQESYPEEKLRELYNANPERFTPSRRLHVREIFKQKQPGHEQEAHETIERIRMEIAKGANFEDLARRESDSPTRSQGGDLGWIDASKPISQRQADALASLKPGEVSDVIELGDGYQVLKLVEVEEPKAGFEGARQVVENAVRNSIIGLAFDEALARYEVKVHNKRLTPRLPHPEVSSQAKASPTAEVTKKPERTPSGRSQSRSRQAPPAVRPPAPEPVPAPTVAPPQSTPGASRPRLFPFLKKRAE